MLSLICCLVVGAWRVAQVLNYQPLCGKLGPHPRDPRVSKTITHHPEVKPNAVPVFPLNSIENFIVDRKGKHQQHCLTCSHDL